jgi:hypothetical protein
MPGAAPANRHKRMPTDFGPICGSATIRNFPTTGWLKRDLASLRNTFRIFRLGPEKKMGPKQTQNRSLGLILGSCCSIFRTWLVGASLGPNSAEIRAARPTSRPRALHGAFCRLKHRHRNADSKIGTAGGKRIGLKPK